MFKLNLKSFVSMVLIGSLACPASLVAATKGQNAQTIAIIPIKHDNDLTLSQINQDLSLSLRNNLKDSFNVLDQNSVNRILKNNFNSPQKDESQKKYVPYIELINQAKKTYMIGRSDDASLKKLDQALSGLLKNIEVSKQSSELVSSANFYKSWILFRAGNKDESASIINKIFVSDKQADFNMERYGKDFSEFVTATRNSIQYDSKISVENILPGNVDVSVNNVFVGTSPMTVSVPKGSWVVSLSADNRKTVSKKVSVSLGKTATVSNVSLDWSREQNKPANDNNLSTSAGILGMASALGNIAKVNKVVFVDVTSAGGKYTPSAQIVDPAYNQVYRPIEYRSVADLKKSAFDIVEFFGSKLKTLLSNDSTNLYKENFDQSLIIDPRMDALKDQKPLTKKPGFWIGVGTVVAAGVITGILMSRDHNSSDDGTGSVTIGFDDFRLGRR